MMLALLLPLLPAGALALDWDVRNNTNLRYGDAHGLDFSLPANTTEADGIKACADRCELEASCAAWVLVRTQHRCALKGHGTGWCVDVEPDDRCVGGIKPGANVTNCTAPTPKPPPGPPVPPPGTWRLPPIDWAAGGVVGPTDQYAVRAFDVVHWEPENKYYLYCDLVLFSNPKCPSSFGSEIGMFSADSLDGAWTYHGIAVPKNHTLADAGGLATPTAIVRDGKVFVYFAYEGLPAGAGLRGIGGASATHPLGPFTRTPPVALAPAGWHRPTGPGGILDDPEVIYWGGKFHLFHSRKHLQQGDNNCSRTPDAPEQSPWWGKCVEWRTSSDGISWKRMGVLDSQTMSETMSARVYPNNQLVLMTDGGGMVAFTTNASGLMASDASQLGPWTAGVPVNNYAGLNGSFVNVALRVLPIDAEVPTHVAMGWRPPHPQHRLDGTNEAAASTGPPPEPCHGGMTFAVFPLEK